MSNRYPKLVALDLDYTLWDLWIDTHVTGPFRREGNNLNEIVDAEGQKVSFYHEVPSVLHRLRMAGVILAICSRTAAPKLARQALELMLVPPSKAEPHEPPLRAIEFFTYEEIYPTSKIVHFKALHKKTELPYSEMLFFDDEHRNMEVEKLGVTFHLVNNGLDEHTLEDGLTEWRQRHTVEESKSDEQQIDDSQTLDVV